jgi:tRNA-2-methylthio-N6-dimethylallyladenosine synthase
VAPKYFLETFGCQMNFHDGEQLATQLETAGYERTALEPAADVVVINTCSVRERAEEKLYTRLGEIRAATVGRAEQPVLAVTGCVAQQEGARLLARRAAPDLIVGTQALTRFVGGLEKARATQRPVIDIQPHDDVSISLSAVRPSDPVRAWVTIIEGCNEFCAFCVVPYTRGHERMRPVARILAEVEGAVQSGRHEIQLLGQIVNHYQAPDDAACDFAELLRRVSAVPGVWRVRFASPHPRHVNQRLMDVLRDVPEVCRHLHMPVQSGSNRILGLMRRRYSREFYLDLVEQLRRDVPGIALSTDVIVGFPTESEGDFEATLDLVRHARYHSMFSFKYSPRPNTLALKRLPDDVPEADKTRRIMALQALQKDIQGQWFDSAVGGCEEVLVDGVSRRRGSELTGRTRGNTVVNFPGPSDWIGRLVGVRITAPAPNSLRGEVVSSDIPGAR